ncbi:MAG: hypothetical protein IPJ06_14930 [Saprospiraceae bacterium]|nr:hypothetical protein [Saprospiraceae bacterium]
MKYFNLFFLIFIVLLISTSFKHPRKAEISENKCDVANFYSAIEPDNGVKILTSGRDLVEAELILVPTRIDEGSYKVEISRKGSNIYKLEGTKYYIETRYCYEYATYEDAILKVISNYGYQKGTLYFN